MRAMKTQKIGLRSSVLITAIVLAAATSPAHAHAIAGMRLFPATLTFDDPGVADETSWIFSHINAGGSQTNSLDLAYAKTITPRLGLVYRPITRACCRAACRRCAAGTM